MRLIFQIISWLSQLISWLSLILLTAPAIFFLAGRTELDTVKNLMLAASTIWFVSASLWMWKEKPQT
jgi:hypothetical protein